MAYNSDFQTDAEGDVRQARTGGFIYCIGAESVGGPVKFGWSMNPEKRMVDLQVGSPLKLVLIGKVPGSQVQEFALHTRLRAARLHGEWFDRTSEVNETVGSFRSYVSYDEAVRRLVVSGILPKSALHLPDK